MESINITLSSLNATSNTNFIVYTKSYTNVTEVEVLLATVTLDSLPNHIYVYIEEFSSTTNDSSSLLQDLSSSKSETTSRSIVSWTPLISSTTGTTTTFTPQLYYNAITTFKQPINISKYTISITDSNGTILTGTDTSTIKLRMKYTPSNSQPNKKEEEDYIEPSTPIWSSPFKEPPKRGFEWDKYLLLGMVFLILLKLMTTQQLSLS
jgi:hypothetical protein